MEITLNNAKAGERLRQGVQIAIIGKPNVGKSTLLNRILQRPAAIVSPLEGTVLKFDTSVKPCLFMNTSPFKVLLRYYILRHFILGPNLERSPTEVMVKKVK